MGFFFHHLRGETKKVIIRLPLGSFRRFQLKSMNYSGLSLKKLITIFYGTPFNLNFEKIRCVNFNRYCVSIPEIYVEKFEVLINYLIILSSCLHEVKKHVEYD